MGKRSRHHYNQSAVLPFRGQGKALRILMITSTKKKQWVTPKGVIEPGLSAVSSAAKEAMEEAGALGVVFSRAIGTYTYKKKRGDVCSVRVFVMKVEHVLHSWPEEFRDRAWVRRREAIYRAREPGLKKLIKKLPKFLKREKNA